MSRAVKIARAVLAQEHAALVSKAARVCVDRANSVRLKDDPKTQAVYRGRAIELQRQATNEYDHARRLLGVE